MKWYQIKNKKPELGIDVLICFEPGNPFSCDVCSLEDEGEGHYVWWRIEKVILLMILIIGLRFRYPSREFPRIRRKINYGSIQRHYWLEI